MLAVGQLGQLGRLGGLGLAGRNKTLVQQALAILAKYGSAANMYLPGVGAINGITAGNWLDSAGTTAAAVGGDVGLAASTAKAEGANVFLDSAMQFGGGSSRVSPGVYRIYSSVGASSNAIFTAGLTQNKTYRLRFNVDSITAGSLAIDGPAGSVVSLVSAGAGSKECVISMTSSASISIKRFSGATDIQISNISAREVPGAHLTQSTAANRPILRLSGGVYSWQFDGSNDSFATALAPSDDFWICSGVTFNGADNVLEGVISSGTNVGASRGISLSRYVSARRVVFISANGTNLTTAYVDSVQPINNGRSLVVEGLLTPANQSCGINGVWGAYVARSGSVQPQSQTPTVIGRLGNGSFLNGSMFALVAINAPTNSSDRATLRKFIASLSGVTM